MLSSARVDASVGSLHNLRIYVQLFIQEQLILHLSLILLIVKAESELS